MRPGSVLLVRALPPSASAAPLINSFGVVRNPDAVSRNQSRAARVLAGTSPAATPCCRILSNT